MKKICLAIVLLSFLPRLLWAQCCSTGSPVGASTHVGILGQKNMRTSAFFRYSNFENYYKEKTKDELRKPLWKTYYEFIGFSVAYGVTKKLTLEGEAGGFITKTQKFNNTLNSVLKSSGPAGGSISVKYGLYFNPESKTEITAGTGFKFPFSRDTIYYSDNISLPRELNPSQGSFGFIGHLFLGKGVPNLRLRFMSINRVEYNMPDLSEYQSGMFIMSSVFISYMPIKYTNIMLQFRSEWRERDVQRNNDVINTGSYLLLVSPQIAYSINGEWHLAAIADIPVFRSYTGRQIGNKYSFAISLTKNFNFCK